MSALTSVLIELETVGIKLIPKGENLEIVGPPDALTEDIIQQLKDHKTEILQLIDQTLHGLSIEELRRLALAGTENAPKRAIRITRKIACPEPDDLLEKLEEAGLLPRHVDPGPTWNQQCVANDAPLTPSSARC